MNDTRQARLIEVFRAAMKLEGAERAAFLDRECGSDAHFREDVETLIEGQEGPWSQAEETDPAEADRAGMPKVESTILRHFAAGGGTGEKVENGSADGSKGETRARAPVLPSELIQRTKVGDKRYVFRGEVGRGGMGAVLKVFDNDLRRNLAMKVILGGDQPVPAEATPVPPHMVDRFLEEAQITGQLEHPGVVPVHELGVDGGGRIYFTMRLVRGKSFSEVIDLARSGLEGWTLPRALSTVLRICETVAYAHTRGVVHRDLKPANVMTGRFGETYVMDWGAARVLSAEEEDLTLSPASGTFAQIRTDRRERATGDVGAPETTQEGTVIGTPYYMPSEQAAGRLAEVGPHSDVYSVGGMLYHLLTGLRPYEDGERQQTVMEIVAAVLSGPPTPIHEIAPEVPSELVSICEKAMAHDWTERYPSMLDMAEDLRAYLEGRVVGAHESGSIARIRKWTLRNKALAASLFALLVLGAASLLAFAYLQNTKLRAVQAEQARTTAALLSAEENERAATESSRRAREESYVANIAAAEASLGSLNIREAKRRLAAAPEERRGWEWDHLSLAADASQATLSGHTDRIRSVTMSSSGDLLASGSADGTVRVWNAKTGDEVRTFSDAEEPLESAVFTPDGRLFAFGGWVQGTLRTFDVESGVVTGAMNLPAKPVTEAVSSRDGKLAAFGGIGNVVHVVDLETGQETHRLEGHQGSIHALSFAAEGARLLSGSEDGTVKLWDTGTGAQLGSHESPDGAVYSVAFHPSGSEFVVGSEGGAVTLYDLEEGSSSLLTRHAEIVYAVTYSPDGVFVASGSFDKTIRVLHPGSGRVRTLIGHELPVRCLAFGPGGRILVSGSEDQTLRIWDVDRAEPVRVVPGDEDLVQVVAVDPTGARLAVGSHFGGGIRFLDPSSGSPLGAIPGQDDPVNALDFSPDGARLAAGFDEEACIRVYDVEGERTLRSFWLHQSSVTSVAFAPGGELLASGSTDFTVKLWAVEPNELAHDFAGHPHAVHEVAFAPEGTALAAAYADGSVLVWDVETRERTRTLEGHTGGAFALAWSPDGGRLLVAAGDQALYAWDLSEGGSQEPTVLAGHDHRTTALAWSPDGSRVVSGSYDASLRVWETAGWTPLSTLHGHEDAVSSVAFTVDGVSIVSGSFDNTVRIWRTR